MKTKFVIRRYDGDDSCSWAVFKLEDVRGMGNQIFYGQATPIVCGLNKMEAKSHKRVFEDDHK